MKEQLGKLASIQTGYSLRTRIEPKADGSLQAIQMKDLTDDSRVDCSQLVRIELEKVGEHHFARLGDLVLRSRGQNPKSALIDVDPGSAIVISPLLRIRIKDVRLTSEYLNWFINQKDAQAWLASRMMGSHGGMITKGTVEELEIEIPPREKQNLVVELAALSEREKSLMKELSNKKSDYVNAIILKYLKGERK